MHLILTAVNPP